MNTGKKPAFGWRLVAGTLGFVAVLLACGVSGGVDQTATPVPTAESVLHLEDGAVKMQDDHGNWVPVGGETTFELVGGLESTNPWRVTGNTFAIRDSTQIAEGLGIGDWVRVKGVILEDATWLANSI